MQKLIQILPVAAFLAACLLDAEAHNSTYHGVKCGGKEKASTLLDVARDFMNNAKLLYPSCTDDDLECGQKEKSLAYLEVAMNLISEVKKNYPTCPDAECPKLLEMPADCSEILQSGKNESGVYTIWPKSRISSKKPLTVYCDMDTDGGGWTVIQRRGNFSNPKDYFYKDWAAYKAGFGNVKEDFWIGNDNIFAISNQAANTIRFDLEDAQGEKGYAQYTTFWIDDEAYKYTLHIKGYSGNVGDGLETNDNMKFSTKDKKHDNYGNVSCAHRMKGAWWYNKCSLSSLNGMYQPGTKSYEGIYWDTWRQSSALRAVEIKLRRI